MGEDQPPCERLHLASAAGANSSCRARSNAECFSIKVSAPADRFADLFTSLPKIAAIEGAQAQAEAVADDFIAAGFPYARASLAESWHASALAERGDLALRTPIAFAARELPPDGDLYSLDEGRLAVPMIYFGRLVGAIEIVADPRAPLRDVERRRLRSYGDLAAFIIESKRQAESMQREADTNALIAGLSAHTRSTLNRNDMLAAVVRDVRVAFKADRCVVYMRDRVDYSAANVIAVDDPGTMTQPMPPSFKIAGSWLQEVLDKGRVVRRDLAGQDAPEDRLMMQYGVHAVLLVPFMADGKVEAGMSIQFGRQHSFNESDLTMLNAVATHVGLALANAQAYEEQHRLALQRAALFEASRAVTGYLSLEPLANATARVASALTRSQRTSIYVPRNGRLQRVGYAGDDYPDLQTRERVTLDDPILGPAFRTGEVTTIIDGDRDPRMRAIAPFLRHAVIVPIIAGSREHLATPVGVMAIARSSLMMRPFDADEVRLAETMASLLAVGLKNVELFEEASAANRVLAESNEFKDDLLAMFAHDFKGPLTVISGFCELLQESGPPESRADLETIAEQTRRLAQLADDALLLVRTQAEGFTVSRTVQDLVGLVRSTAIKHDHGMHRISFATTTEPIWVAVDRGRFEQVLDNLVSNALKYSEGPIAVSVSTDEVRAKIMVSDNGIGIPEEEIKRIFTRFGRASNARRKGIAGSGIGLYITRKIVEAHAGEIEIISREDEGSTFAISLPLATRARLRNALIIDDDPGVRRLLGAMLADCADHLTLANDENEARAHLAAERFDVVLISAEQPGGVAQFVKAVHAGPSDGARIVVLAGDVTVLPPGVHSLLRKPFRRRELLSTLAFSVK